MMDRESDLHMTHRQVHPRTEREPGIQSDKAPNAGGRAAFLLRGTWG